MNVSVLIISISNPLLIGVYKDNKLIKSFEGVEKTSDELPKIFSQLNSEYNIKRIFYVNSPGSYMAIKVAYMFLKSLSVIKNIPLYATNGFNFNQNSPIKALGKKYFIKKDEDIVVDFISEDTKLKGFILPLNLDETIFSEENLPKYYLPAV